MLRHVERERERERTDTSDGQQNVYTDMKKKPDMYMYSDKRWQKLRKRQTYLFST